MVGCPVIRRILLAAVALRVSMAPVVCVAEIPSSALAARAGGVVRVASEEGRSDDDRAAPVSCPYGFGSDMPAATFCVYEGIALDGDGEVCATDVVVIWSSLASQAPGNGGRGEPALEPKKDVYLGFVDDPELVVRAIVDPRQSGQAEMVEYRIDSEEAPRPLAGQLTLRAVRLGSTEVLTMDLRDPGRLRGRGCGFASYSGTFLGMLQPPGDTATAVDPFSVPRQSEPSRSGAGSL